MAQPSDSVFDFDEEPRVKHSVFDEVRSEALVAVAEHLDIVHMFLPAHILRQVTRN